jgi:hypothetical protein
MSYKVLLTLLLLVAATLSCIAQQQKEAKAGVITLVNTQMMGFNNLKISEDNVTFTNVATRTEVTYPLTEVSLIEDDNQKTVFKGSPPVKPKPAVTVNDTLYRPNYPGGIYKTKEDFINKKPSSREFVLPVGLTGNYLENIEHNCFFFDGEGDKIKNAFAISYDGNLYFHVGAILKYRNKKDRAQTDDVAHQFVRVIIGGDNYFYTEADLANLWAQALAYGGVGGIAGTLLAKSFVYGKGVVWDFKNREFNIFKNCKDYNTFIEPLYSEGVQDCNEQQPDMYKVRKAIEKIK